MLLMLQFGDLDFLAIFTNTVITGVISCIGAHFLLRLLFRIFDYEYVFIEETGAIFVDANRDKKNAGWLIHIVISVLLISLYSVPYLILLAVVSGNQSGVYRFDAQGTAIRENLFYMLPFSVFVFLFWVLLSSRSRDETQYSLLFAFALIFCIFAGIIYGMYGFGFLEPGLIQ